MKIEINHKVIPVLVIDDASWAKELGQVMIDSGLPIIEVTLRTQASWSAAENMREVVGLHLGIGSVTTPEDLDRGRDMGVDFAVSAGLRHDLVEHAIKLGIPYIPGVATASEILHALEMGLSTLKYFPAESLGGISALKAISAPFPKMKFIPTGGINLANAQKYLAEGNVVAVGGSWMFSKDDMQQKNLKSIALAAQNAAEIA